MPMLEFLASDSSIPIWGHMLLMCFSAAVGIIIGRHT